MLNLAHTYAVLAGVSLATYIVCSRLGSTGIHPIRGTAISAGPTLAIRAGGAPIPFTTGGIWILIVVGVATAGVNLFTPPSR